MTEDSCRFEPQDWQDWPGIDGPVLICHTNGYPGVGSVYDYSYAHGVCEVAED